MDSCAMIRPNQLQLTAQYFTYFIETETVSIIPVPVILQAKDVRFLPGKYCSQTYSLYTHHRHDLKTYDDCNKIVISKQIIFSFELISNVENVICSIS